MRKANIAAAVIFMATFATLSPAEIVGWRMGGDGRYPEAQPRETWSNSEGVIWKTPMDAPSNASPVLLEKASLVIVLSEPDEIVAVDTRSGAVAWRASTADIGGTKVGAHRANGRTSATPVSDGSSLFALFGSGEAAAYDLQGNRLWGRVVQPPKHRWGHSASPVLAGGNLVVHLVDLIALDPATGREVWRAASENRWGSPVAARIGEDEIVITPSGDAFNAVDGSPVASGIGSLKFATPVVQDGVVYFIEKRAVAVRLPATLDGPFEPLWETRLQGSRHYASPLIHDGRIYAVSREQRFSILDAASGELLHESALDLEDKTNSAYPSIALAGDRVFLATEDGTTVVLQPGSDYRELARNSLGGLRSSPVFSGGRMYLRTFDNLYCIGSE